MKLLDLNTHSWIEENPKKKLEDFVSFLIQGDYDIITLQEVNQLISENVWQPDDFFCPVENQRAIKEDNFAKVVVEKLKLKGKSYYWSWADAHIGYDHYDEGVAILSKNPIFPFSAWVSQIQNRSDYHTRVLLYGYTRVDDRDICIASAHFSWWDDFKQEWQETEKLLSQMSSECPIVVMGDFNNPAEVRSEGYDYVTENGLGLVDAFIVAEKRLGEHTVSKEIDGWKGNSQKLRIDLAWVSREVGVTSYQVVFDGETGPIVSDHYGITIEAAWK